MAGSRFFCVALLWFITTTVAGAQSPASPVSLTPSVVVAGSPELIRVAGPRSAHLEGEWLGRKLQFFRNRDNTSWIALAGIDVEAPVGPSTLTVHGDVQPGGATIAFNRTIEIHAAHYATGALTVLPKFIEPSPEQQQQIAADSKIKENIFASSAAEPLWSGDFRAPVRAPATDSFGKRRTFNGKLASIHKGMDFRAATGTVVRAANSGIVVLARPLYFEGNCVVIDHGLGLYTVSMHFSRIDVKEGQHVRTGDPLGLSGATGRVTGPHLHWAVRWQGAYLDPAKLLHMDLSTVR